MLSETVQCNANGRAAVNIGGRGFRVKRARGVGQTARPGSFPVVFETSGRRYLVTSAESRYLSEAERFEGGTLFGEAGDSFVVETFVERDEGLIAVGGRGSVAVPVQAATAAPTAAPTLDTDGWKIRPGTLSTTFYASGVLGNATLWVRTARGVWVDTLEVLDFATAPVQTRQAIASADRVYLRAAAGTLNLEVDQECEVD